MQLVSNCSNNKILSYQGIKELWAIEEGLKSYNKYVVSNFVLHSRPNDKVLDFGSGIGTLALIWKGLLGKNPDCFEVDPVLKAICEERGFTCLNSFDESQIDYDFIYSSNVLEHIENDFAAIELMYQNLKDGGRLGIYVPALQNLFSEIDRKVGHFRRYEKLDLENKIISAGFLIKESRYVDSLGLYIWKLINTLNLGSGLIEEGSKSLKIYDRILFPLSKFMDKIGFNRYHGKNLLLIAEKPSKD